MRLVIVLALVGCSSAPTPLLAAGQSCRMGATCNTSSSDRCNDSDGCNQCFCLANGTLDCTTVACDVGASADAGR